MTSRLMSTATLLSFRHQDKFRGGLLIKGNRRSGQRKKSFLTENLEEVGGFSLKPADRSQRSDTESRRPKNGLLATQQRALRGKVLASQGQVPAVLAWTASSM